MPNLLDSIGLVALVSGLALWVIACLGFVRGWRDAASRRYQGRVSQDAVMFTETWDSGCYAWRVGTTARNKEIGLEADCTGSPNCVAGLNIREGSAGNRWLECHLSPDDVRWLMTGLAAASLRWDAKRKARDERD